MISIHTARVAPEKLLHHQPAAVFFCGGQGDDMEWSQQYKHPEWQRRRLKRLESAGFMCQMCFSTEKQLHVHHKRYVKGRLIWQYEDFELEVACHDCHDEAHELKELIARVVARFPVSLVMSIAGLLVGYAENSGVDTQDDEGEVVDERAVQIGRLAGAATSVLGMDEIIRLRLELEERFRAETSNISQDGQQ